MNKIILLQELREDVKAQIKSYLIDMKRDMLAKKNKCKPEQVTCLNCYYKWGDKYFCNYHRCGLLNFDEPCYKFKYCIR